MEQGEPNQLGSAWNRKGMIADAKFFERRF